MHVDYKYNISEVWNFTKFYEKMKLTYFTESGTE